MLASVKDILRRFAPADSKSRYLSYTVHHHKDDSLMRRVIPPLTIRIRERFSSTKVKRMYEPVETGFILSTLHGQKSACVLDIGANIGLMSLNICEFNKDATIYAFEPGTKQFRFLKLNVTKNNLSGRIVPFNIALGDKTGYADFYSHDTEHSSGDGFRETGRIGNAEIIKVRTETLDGWWQANEFVPVTTIKIDTEGAELLILRQGLNLIQKCRPIILIEIAQVNFSSYDLQYSDFIDFFGSNGFTLVNLGTNAVVHLPGDFQDAESYFIAIPTEKYQERIKALTLNRFSHLTKTSDLPHGATESEKHE